MDVSQRANAVGNDLDQTLHGALAGTPSYLSCVSVLDTGCNALVFLSAPGGDESFIDDILLVGWLVDFGSGHSNSCCIHRFDDSEEKETCFVATIVIYVDDNVIAFLLSKALGSYSVWV